MKIICRLQIFALFIILCFRSYAQSTSVKRVLFIGNSYTYSNNLPQMIADMADSVGDSLIFDSSTPGGYTFQLHSTNATTLSKIALGNWDYVVLQEQSQLPSFQINQVEANVFPYAKYLDSLIRAYNPCAETVFYMTWGRKFGDASNCASWPPVCTYEGMDSLLNLRYRMMADSNYAILSPVGEVWKYLRLNSPAIDLYQADLSHPSLAGTYAAACSFYTAFFRKNPLLNLYNGGLSAGDALQIKNAAKVVVFDSLQKHHIGEYDPLANFSVQNIGSGVFQFTNTSLFASSYQWNFGDGNISTQFSPSHAYVSNGNYIVELVSKNCGISDTLIDTIQVNTVVVNNLTSQHFSVYPNPCSNELKIQNTFGKKTNFCIMNTLGDKISEGFISREISHLDISNWKNGIYFLHLWQEENHSVLRIVKSDH